MSQTKITLPPDLERRRRNLIERIQGVEFGIQKELDDLKGTVDRRLEHLQVKLDWYNKYSKLARELQLEIHWEYIKQTGGDYFVIEDGHFDVEPPKITVPYASEILGSAKECISTDLNHVLKEYF